MPRIIVKENFYVGPCGHAWAPEGISEVSEHFCKAMSRDFKLRKKCEGCPSPYRYRPPVAPAGRKIFDPEAALREQRRERLSLSERTPFSERVRESGGAKKTLPNVSPLKPVVAKLRTPVFFTPVSKPADLPPLTGQPSVRGSAWIERKKSKGRKIWVDVDDPENLEARAKKGRKALARSDRIDKAGRAVNGGVTAMAATLHITPSEASELRRLQKLSPRVRGMVAKGHIATSTAAVIALYPELVQAVLIEGLKDSKVTVSDLTHGVLYNALRQDKLREYLKTLGIKCPEQEE